MVWRRGRSKAAEKAEGPARLPEAVSVPTRRGESVLAAAQDDLSGAWVALTTFRFVVLSEAGEVLTDRPWHEVGAGAWDPETGTLSLTWVGSDRAVQWSMSRRTGPGHIPEVFRERVSASVVRVREVRLGPGRTARVSVRAVLSTRELTDQVVFGRGAGSADAELVAEADRVRREVRAEAGLPPTERG